ncbi:LacI family DNA-binding transcriptional regulator [Roseburia hominis]
MKQDPVKYQRTPDAAIRVKDLAAKAGVSPTTVSNVIHGNTGKVSAETVRKVRKLLEESGYVANMAPRLLAGSGSRIIGVLIGSGTGSVAQQAFYNILIRALEEELYRRNYYMMLHVSDSPEENMQFAAIWRVEGLITLGMGAAENQKIQANGKMPVVSVDTYYESGQPVANVGLDDFGGGYLMGTYLLDAGHEKICFLADNDVGVDHFRWKGLKRACMDTGVFLGEDAHVMIPQEQKKRAEFYKKNLAQLAFSHDVLFFASDYYAMEALSYLHDMGIRVPDEISVAGYDNNEYAVLARPRLTTIHQDAPAKAQAAVEKLLAFIQGTGPVSMAEKLPVHLVIRDSVAEEGILRLKDSGAEEASGKNA